MRTHRREQPRPVKPQLQRRCGNRGIAKNSRPKLALIARGLTPENQAVDEDMIGSAKRNNAFGVMRVDARDKLVQRCHRPSGFHKPNDEELSRRWRRRALLHSQLSCLNPQLSQYHGQRLTRAFG